MVVARADGVRGGGDAMAHGLAVAHAVGPGRWAGG